MVSHKLMGVLILHGLCLFKLFPIGPKELEHSMQVESIKIPLFLWHSLVNMNSLLYNCACINYSPSSL